MAKKGIVDFVMEEEDGIERDFHFKFTGRTSTKSIEGSFIEAQLNYVGNLLDQEKIRAIEVWPKLKEMSSRGINIEHARKRMEERADEIPDDPNADNDDGDELEGLRQGVTDFCL